MHARAAEFLLGDVLADGGLHEVRTRERHRAAALDHRHEVGEAGNVGGAGGARPHQRGDLGDHAAHHDLLAEQVPGAREHRAGGLLHARTGGVEQPDERHPLRQRQLAQACDLDLAGHPHRAGHHREVIRADGRQPAVDLAVAGDHAVRRRLHPIHRPLREMRPAVDAQLGERAVVDQQRDPLARGELFAFVLLLDLLLAAAISDLRAARLEILDEGTEETLGALGSRGTTGLGRFALRVLGLGDRGRAGGGLGAHQRPFHSGSRFSKKAVDTLDDVLGGERQRELRAQVVERVVEGHVELAAHRLLAEPHDHRRLPRQLLRPVGDRDVEVLDGDDPVDDPRGERLLRAPPLPEQQQLVRLLARNIAIDQRHDHERERRPR